MWQPWTIAEQWRGRAQERKNGLKVWLLFSSWLAKKPMETFFQMSSTFFGFSKDNKRLIIRCKIRNYKKLSSIVAKRRKTLDFFGPNTFLYQGFLIASLLTIYEFQIFSSCCVKSFFCAAVAKKTGSSKALSRTENKILFPHFNLRLWLQEKKFLCKWKERQKKGREPKK